MDIKYIPLFLIVCFGCSGMLFAETPLPVYVDAKNIRGVQKGTEESPFRSLEQAIDFVHEYARRQKTTDSLPATIYLQSDVFVQEGLLITLPVRIRGVGNPVLSFGDNAGFIIEKTYFDISNCVIKRRERKTEPRVVPVFYGGQSTVILHHVSVTVEEGDEVAIFRRSRFFCFDSSFYSKQSAQALLVRADSGLIMVLRSSFTAEGVTGICFDLTDSECTVRQSRCRLLTHYTGRSAEVCRSKLSVRDFSAVYESSVLTASDAAIVADRQSVITTENTPLLDGFSALVVRHR